MWQAGGYTVVRVRTIGEVMDGPGRLSHLPKVEKGNRQSLEEPGCSKLLRTRNFQSSVDEIPLPTAGAGAGQGKLELIVSISCFVQMK